MSIMRLFLEEPRFRLGDVVYRPGGRLGPRTQRNLQLVYVYSGEARVLVDGHCRRVGARQATLLLPGHRESFEFARNRPTRHGWCEVIEARLAPRIDGTLAALPSVAAFTPRMASLARMALALGRSEEPSTRRVRDALAHAILWEFLRVAGFGEELAEPLPEPLARAVSFVEAHHTEELTLPLLARAAGVTPSHLIRLFRARIGLTPMRHVWRTRVEIAARLLRETGLSVAEVAYRTGFRSPFHFSRLARHQLGASPRAWRRRTWGRTVATDR